MGKPRLTTQAQSSNFFIRLYKVKHVQYFRVKCWNGYYNVPTGSFLSISIESQEAKLGNQLDLQGVNYQRACLLVIARATIHLTQTSFFSA